MKNNPLDGVYRIEGIYADPFDVISKLKSTSSRRERKELVDQIRSEGLMKNKLISREIAKIEFDEGMSN
jgi:hypothetical protein